uniref:Putative trypsin inhibitor like cysteine rich domain protein n=1 Tax=Lutzomyia longipalpis TaxID=7200 RepID=A0A7G3AWD6_LUTLO
MYAVVIFLAAFGTLASADFYSNFPSAGGSYSGYSTQGSQGSSQVSCNKEYEYYDNCASPCEETCGNYQNFFELKNTPECSLRNCAPKCKCVSGYVRHNNGRCVPKTECKNQEFHHATRGNRQPYFYPQPYSQQYPQQQFENQQYDQQYFGQQYGNQYDAGSYFNEYNKY